MRAVHPPQEVAFANETFPEIGVEAVVLGQHLDGHVGVEPIVAGTEHGGEGADAQQLDDGVAAELAGDDGAHRPSRSLAAARARPRATLAFTVLRLSSSRSATSA